MKTKQDKYKVIRVSVEKVELTTELPDLDFDGEVV